MKPIIFAVLAGLCWGIGELFTRSVLHTHRVGPVTAIAVRSLIALPVLWGVWALCIFGLKMPSEPRDWLNAGTPTLLKLILGSGLIAGAGGMIFFYLALATGEVSRVKPIAFALAPATAVVLGMLILGEPVTARKIVAVALILTGVILLTGK